jgi:hypothetical protein
MFKIKVVKFQGSLFMYKEGHCFYVVNVVIEFGFTMV